MMAICFLLSFLESVPELAGKLPDPHRAAVRLPPSLLMLLHGGLDGGGAQFGGGHGGKTAPEGADGGAYCGNDDDFTGHGK